MGADSWFLYSQQPATGSYRERDKFSMYPILFICDLYLYYSPIHTFKCSLPLRFSYQNFVSSSLSSNMLCMPRPPRHPSLDHSSNIWRYLQIVEVLIYCSFSQLPITYFLWGQNILISTQFSGTFNLFNKLTELKKGRYGHAVATFILSVIALTRSAIFHFEGCLLIVL
jgi:hypothetical protein